MGITKHIIWGGGETPGIFDDYSERGVYRRETLGFSLRRSMTAFCVGIKMVQRFIFLMKWGKKKSSSAERDEEQDARRR